MKKLTRTVAILCVLLAFSSVAAAAGPEPGPFSTTGYTTAYEFVPLPLAGDIPESGYAKFHLRAQGEPDEDVCSTYPDVEKPCGTDRFFPAGSFAFDEWGVAQYIMIEGYPDPVPIAAANHGLMTITTATGSAEVRFGGIADYQTNPLAPTVTGSFTFLDGADAYKGLKGDGTYAGGAGLVFNVDYTPCGKDCPVDRCAIFGEDLEIKKDKVEWKISNLGETDLTVSKVTIVWPDDNGPITKVKLGGKTISEESLTLPAAAIDLTGWKGKEKNIQLGAGKKGEKLEIEFKSDKGLDISPTNPWDYTILVEFEGGCAVPFVAFAPPSQP